MDSPLISVVIPVFNRQDKITYCLDSILGQTYKNIEVVVVDDCSTDKTVSVVRSYKDPRVRCVVLEKNSGAQAARNRGIHEAKADWIAFQDSDDEWLLDKLEKQVSVLASADYNPWSLVYCNAYRLDEARGIKTVRLFPVVEGENPYATLLLKRAVLFSTMLTSKDALEKIGYLDEQVPTFQEWDTSISLARFCRFTHLKEPLMIYHAGGDDAISGSAIKHVEGLYYIISKYEKDIKGLRGQKAWWKLNVQLLGLCLCLGLKEHYDSFLSMRGMASEYHFIMFYLKICRKYNIVPNNIIYRIYRKIFARPDFFTVGQGEGHIKKV